MAGIAKIDTVSNKKVFIFDSATYVQGYFSDNPTNKGNIIVNASYSGVLCAKMVMHANPSFVVGLDCKIGKEGAGIDGLAFYEALNIPAVAADVMTAEMGNGVDLYECGVVSRMNESAERLGIKAGMSVEKAIKSFATVNLNTLAWDPSRRSVIETNLETGRSIVCTDSIAFALAEDKDRNVLCTAGHTGRSVIEYFRLYRPWGFICSDGGIGKNNSGISALDEIVADGIPGASVDALTAKMGSGHSTYFDGVISAANQLAKDKGVYIGQAASEAAKLLLD